MTYSDPNPPGIQPLATYSGHLRLEMPNVTSDVQVDFTMAFTMGAFEGEDPSEGFQSFIDHLAAYPGVVAEFDGAPLVQASRTWSVSQQVTPTTTNGEIQ